MKLERIKTITMGILRVSVYLACAGGVAAWVTYVEARDRVDHVLGELGIGLLAELGQLEAGVEQVELNGQPFTFGAAVSEQDPDALVASFEAQCADAAGTLEEDLGPIIDEAKKRGHKLPEKPLDQWFTSADRSDDGQAARGACFVRPEDKASNSLWDRLESFANTGHLGKIGGFRYLRADRADDADTTRVLAISSNGDFDIEAMLPDTGDARGTDPVVATRPPKSVRTFSARVSGRSQGAYLYASQATPAEVIAHYDAQLGKQRQLNRVELPDGKGKQRQDARVYASGDGAVVLSVQPDEDAEGASVVTILEIGELADAKRGG